MDLVGRFEDWVNVAPKGFSEEDGKLLVWWIWYWFIDILIAVSCETCV